MNKNIQQIKRNDYSLCKATFFPRYSDSWEYLDDISDVGDKYEGLICHQHILPPTFNDPALLTYILPYYKI